MARLRGTGRVAVAGKCVQHEERIGRIGVETPHVSYATVIADNAPPARNASGRSVNKVANCRRPGRSPGRQAPVTGGSTVTASRSRSRPARSGRLRGAQSRVEVGEDVVDVSIPTESRTRPGVTPVVNCSFGSS